MYSAEDAKKEYPNKIHNKESLKSKKSHKSGLIIKIRSEDNVIVTENTQSINNKVGTSGKEAEEENKMKTARSSCSISTLSMEKQEEKGRKMSECSVNLIELENNTKIICRSIGPLKASERRLKVLHYLKKKRSRKWNKRINYT